MHYTTGAIQKTPMSKIKKNKKKSMLEKRNVLREKCLNPFLSSTVTPTPLLLSSLQTGCAQC